MTCCIYKITSPSGKRYIGQSIDYRKRINDHRRKHKKKDLPKLYQAFKKYGFENFSFEILEECLPGQLNDREIYWIEFYDSFENGYNATTGGQAKFLRSKETKEKLRKINLGKENKSCQIPFKIDNIKYNSIDHAHKALNIPAKTIHNRLNSRNIKYKNYEYIDKSRIPIRQTRKVCSKKCTINNIEYSSASEASKALNINYSTLCYKLRLNKYIIISL